MRTSQLTPQYVEQIPKPRDPSVLYVSRRYELAIHLCACGCGNEAVTPLGSNAEPGRGWTLQEHADGSVTLEPSILNTACGAHYFIRSNVVEWC